MAHMREILLQLIWEKQYIQQDHLVTADGRPIRVIDAGRVSLEPGPDIRKARVMIDGIVYAGDVEIHRTGPEWISHGHHTDPRYNVVILHVVLESPPTGFMTVSRAGRSIPMLALTRFLVRPMQSILQDVLFDELDIRTGRLRCAGQANNVPEDVLSSYLERLAVERIEIKLRRFEERMNELVHRSVRAFREGPSVDEPGYDNPASYAAISPIERSQRTLWEQLLYEGCLEGLGYARNRRPCIRLSRLLTLEHLRTHMSDRVSCEALLFGGAGFLERPAVGADTESNTYVHMLQMEWRSIRRYLAVTPLSPTDWVLSQGRPSNAPHIRLAAGAALARKIINGDLFVRILQTIKQSGAQTRHDLHGLLRVRAGAFWERRVSFTRVVPGRVQPIGEARKDDLIINAIVPLYLLYARVFRDTVLRKGIADMLRRYPSLQSNAVTRRIERHLLDGRVSLTTALRHQGAMQLFNYYCVEGRCSACAVGELVWP